MNKYEVLYILDTKVDGAQKDALIEKYSNLVKENGGEVESIDKWGDKKLAYPIDYKSEGYYVLMNVECSVEARDEIDRQMGIDDNVMRSMFIKK